MSRSFHVRVFLLIGLLHALVLGWQLLHRTEFFPDSDRYVQEAANIAQYGRYYASPLNETIRPQEFTIRPPGYPLFLVLTNWLGGGAVLTLVLQNLLSLLNIWLILRWLREFALSRAQVVALLLALLTFPAQLIYANALMSELLLQTCVTGLALGLDAYLRRQRLSGWILASLLTTAALLIKPVFFPFALVLLPLGGWLAWRRRNAELLAWGALPLAVAILYMSWNYERTGYFHFSSIAEINLLRYNVRAVLRATEGPEAAEAFVVNTVAASERLPDYDAQQHFITAECARVLARNPLAYGVLHARGMVNFFLDPGRFDLVHFLNLPEEGGLLQSFSAQGYGGIWQKLRGLQPGLLLTLALVFLANLLRLAALLLFLFDRRAPLLLRLVVTGLILYVALLTGPLGAARFVVPVFPLLLVPIPFAVRRWNVWTF